MNEPAVDVRRTWGIGDAIGGLLTSLALSNVAAVVLVGLGLDLLDVVPIVVTIVAGWTGLGVWLYVASYGKGTRSFGDDFGWGAERFDALRGIGAGIVTLVVVGLFSTLVGDDVGDPTFGAVDPSGTFELVLLGAAIVVGAPVIEELFFRGLFLRAVANRTGAAGGVVITSAVFGLLHVPQRGSLGFAQAFVPLLLVGLVLGWLAVRYGRLGPSVAAHMTINAIGFLGLLAN